MPFVILIPSYNPDQALVELIVSLRQKTTMPILVVNDGSKVETACFFADAQKAGAAYIAHDHNRGKGAALKTGIAYALSAFPDLSGVVTADGDGQHIPDDILAVGNAMESHPNSLVLGTRSLRNKNVPFKSRWGNRITTFVFALTSHRKVLDTQTGLRGIPLSLLTIAEKIPGDRYEYEMNMLSDMAKADVPFVPVAIQTVYKDQNKGSHFHAWRDSARIYFPLLSGFLKMAVVSLLSAALDLGLFTLFQWAFWDDSASGIFYSTVSARVLSGIFNFILNKTWTFKSKGESARKALEYGILFVTQMLLSWILVKLFAMLPAHLTLIKAVIDFLLFLGSYFIQKTFIFRPKKVSKETSKAGV